MTYEMSIIVGNLGRDPEMRYIGEEGKPVTNINVAVNKSYTSHDGTKVTRTKWVRVSVFGGQAEPCNLYLKKGRQVLVEGEYTEDPDTGAPKIFTRSDGSPGTSFEMRAKKVVFLGSKDSGDTDSYTGPATQDEDEDDIPF